jgi:Transposase DDE domain
LSKGLFLLAGGCYAEVVKPKDRQEGQTMLLAPIFDQFVKDSPLSVMARALMENALQPGPLDEMFERTATLQYTDKLLFSTVVDTLGLLVCGISRSVNSVYHSRRDWFPVALTNVYQKLNGIEMPVMQQLVRDNAARLSEVVVALGGTLPELLPGFRVKILDGNCIVSSEHRIKELRELASAPLPGKTLNVFDPQLGLVTDVFPCEDGHAQERALLGPVRQTVQAGELWIEDRNFCTVGWLRGVVVERKAHVLVREHQGLPWTKVAAPEGELRYVGRVETGEVFEQTVTLSPEQGTVIKDDGTPLQLRRIVIKLDKPTRDGETEVAVLTDLTAEQADALTLARLYLKRWQIETVFQVLTETLHCEHPRRGYPKAALCAFCVTLVTYNVLAVIKAALRVVHGTEKVENDVSVYHVTTEIQETHRGMMISIRPPEWMVFRSMNATELAAVLRELAGRVDLSKYPKAPTKPKKPKTSRQSGANRPHVSTARVLAQRRKQ